MKPVVLVVDDDTAICALLQDVLSEHVFTVSVCHTGQEAILRIEGDPDIALVVLDMMLPDTNGLRVLQQIQKLRPTLPVVMLTGMAVSLMWWSGWKWARMITSANRSPRGWWSHD